MKTLTLLSAFLLGVGLCFAGPDGKCKKGDCKKGVSADKEAMIQVVLDDDKPGARKGPKGGGDNAGKRRGGKGGGGEFFKKLDADGDGGITLEEMLKNGPTREGGDADKRKAMITKRHAAMDGNSDGKVTMEEIMKGRKGGKPGAGAPGRGGKPGAGGPRKGGKPGAGGAKGGD